MYCEKNLRFENYKHCLETTQLDNKINDLEQNRLGAVLLGDHKRFVRKINTKMTKNI